MARRSRRGGRRHRRGGRPAAPAAAQAPPLDRSTLPKTDETVPLTDLLELLHQASPELQCAACRVLGALKLGSPAAREHLLFLLKAATDAVRGYAMDALRTIGGETPVESYVALLGSSPAMSPKAADELVRQGPAALPVLAERLKAGAPDEFTRAALGVLQRIGTADAARLMLECLPQLSPEMQRPASDQIMAIAPSLDPKQLDELRSDAGERLRAAARENKTDATAALLRLLGRLRDPEVLTLLLSFIGKGQATPVLAAAVGAIDLLGDPPPKMHATLFQKLLTVLDHEDYDQVVRPAIKTLERIPVQKAVAPALEKLSASPHRSVRAYALRQLGQLGGKDSFEAMREGLQSKEHKVSDAARLALSSNPAFIEPLASVLRSAKTAEEAWNISRILQRHRERFPQGLLNQLADATAAMIGSPSPLFQAHFELLRSVAPELLKETLYEKGKALFGRKKYAEAIDALRHLDRHDLAGGDSDLLLALARIAVGPKEAARAGRDHHPGLLLLARVARRSDFDVGAALRRIRAGLQPEDLLFAGFALVEKTGVDRAMGAALLKFLAAQFRSTESGRSAAARLRTERIR
jgi:HEAT repeat protein